MASTKSSITVKYRKAGTHPPVFIAGGFSDPAWVPEEMDCIEDGDGEHTFCKEISGDPGSKIQYKLRLGLGDWWVLNESAPTVSDESGNVNNVIELPSAKESLSKEPVHQDANFECGAATKITANDDMLPNESRAEAEPKPVVANAAKQLLAHSASNSRSGASTPNFARTAAEVADSAALLDQEEPEPDIPDEEAGRLGVRRLSSTPIPEVAKTAAEVADIAKALDEEESAFNLETTPPRAYHDFDQLKRELRQDLASEQRHGDHNTPLFSHEAIGMYESETPPEVNDSDEGEDQRPSQAIQDDHEDYDDPTLERFPSNREEIMDTVRKLETGLNEDHASIGGVPLSSVVGSSRRGTNDMDDYFGTSPLAPVPVVPRPVKRLDVPRSPHGSVTSERSSALSLQSISEAEDEDRHSPVVLVRTPADEGKRTGNSPASDEDEGVSLKENGLGTPESLALDDGASSKPTDPETTRIPHLRIFHATPTEEKAGGKPGVPGGKNDNTQDASPSQRNVQVELDNPRILVQLAEGVEASCSNSQHAEDIGVTDATRSTGVESTGVDMGNSSQLKKRSVGTTGDEAEPSFSAAVQRSTSQGREKKSWLGAFFQILFVNWIGGWVSRLCGSKRKLLLTAGTATVFLGVAWWRYVGKERW